MHKILIDEATAKQALEALEGSTDKTLSIRAMKALRKALAAPDFWEGYVPEPVKQQALDKMAENARELGIQMQPEEPRAWFTVDELNAWADKKLKENPQWAEEPAQQEPVITARQLSLAMRQWDHWKTYALELQERLVKYEGGSPMVLNTPPPTAEENI